MWTYDAIKRNDFKGGVGRCYLSCKVAINCTLNAWTSEHLIRECECIIHKTYFDKIDKNDVPTNISQEYHSQYKPIDAKKFKNMHPITIGIGKGARGDGKIEAINICFVRY